MMTIKKAIEYGQLLESIDFFAQNLSFEQIVSYGYNFIHSIIGLSASGVFVLEENTFVLKQSRDAEFKMSSFAYDGRMDLLATKFGRAMQVELDLYFDADFINTNEITFAFPILVKNKTVAVIFSKSEQFDLSDEKCSASIHGINQMVNKATENAINFKQVKRVNAELDKKIFNLLFVNHSTKAFMSELDLSKLYQLCIDVISEITASTVTSFALYEPQLSKIVLKGYKNILTYQTIYCELETVESTEAIFQIIYHIERDYEKLSLLFKSPEKFKILEAEYIVLLVKKDILGFVTIGKNIGGNDYSMELLNQIESLSSSIYIAISNAQFIQKISRQKNEISTHLNMIEALNRAIKTINSCESLKELSHITMRTINLAFDYTKALIAVKNDEGYQVIGTLGFDYTGEVTFVDKFIEKHGGELYFDPIRNRGTHYIHTSLLKEIGQHNCFVSVPIVADEYNKEKPIGFILAFESKNRLENNQVLALDTIGNSVAPLVKQLKHNEQMKKQFIINQEYEFLKKLNNAIKNRDTYCLDFVVHFKKLMLKPFETFDDTPYEGLQIFIVGDLLLHISTSQVANELFEGQLTVLDTNSFIEEIQTMV